MGEQQSANDSKVSQEERAVRAELRALAAERARILAQIADELEPLRLKQSEFDRARSVAVKASER